MKRDLEDMLATHPVELNTMKVQILLDVGFGARLHHGRKTHVGSIQVCEEVYNAAW